MSARCPACGVPVLEATQTTGVVLRLDPDRRVYDTLRLRDGTLLAERRVLGHAEHRCPPAPPAERPASGAGAAEGRP